ncbi:hypothetical protein BDZ89DRAFT_1138721 [Hymenopellis radicata]|nr:hypothetical protein BDZ89DRAFT_1138721 [Hymenopellis radicata]
MPRSTCFIRISTASVLHFGTCTLVDVVPPELILHIVSYLGRQDVLVLRLTHRRFCSMLIAFTHDVLVLRALGGVDCIENGQLALVAQSDLESFVAAYDLWSTVRGLVFFDWHHCVPSAFVRLFDALSSVTYRGPNLRISFLHIQFLAPLGRDLLSRRLLIAEAMTNDAVYHSLCPDPLPVGPRRCCCPSSPSPLARPGSYLRSVRFPDHLWLSLLPFLCNRDLLFLRVVNRTLARLFAPFTHSSLVLRLPSIYPSPAITEMYTSDMELAVVAFVVRYRLQDVVRRIVFENWLVRAEPLWFGSWMCNVTSVEFRGSRTYLSNNPYILPEDGMYLVLQ